MALNRLRILLLAAISLVLVLTLLALRNLWLVSKLPAILIGLSSLLVAFYLLHAIRKKKNTQYFLPLGAVSMLVLLLEMLIRISLYLNISAIPTYLLRPAFSSNSYRVPLFNSPSARADSISGYRWSKDSVKVLKIGRNEMEYVNTFAGNNAGFYSHRDYQHRKPDSSAYRILVLGDSFTDAYFLATPWAERWEAIMNARGKNVEIYSFGINGGGLINWHQLFLKELMPQYEFDAVVLAIFGNDLDRPFFSMHHDRDEVFLKYFDSLPGPDFRKELLQSEGLPNVLSADQWENIFRLYNQKLSWSSADFFVLHAVVNAAVNLQGKWTGHSDQLRFVERFIVPSKEPITEAILHEKYGTKLLHLEDILSNCAARGKEVYFFCVPEQQGALLSAAGRTPQIVKELAFLANMYGVPFWNGYLPYQHLSEEEIAKHFMRHDGHWNQTGSDFFSRNIPDNFDE
jgi:hypothetical protein